MRRRRHRRHTVHNPRRARPAIVRARRRRHTHVSHSFASMMRRHRRIRRHNPARRHRNPFGVSSGEIINFAIGGLGLGMAQPIVNRLIGGILPLGTFQGPVITAVTGWGLGKLFEMFSATRRFAQPTMIIGLSTAVIQIVQPYVSNLLGGATAAPAPATGMSGWPQGYSGWHPQRIGAMRRRYVRPGYPMRGIGVTTGIPPTITAPPMPPAPAQSSMHGLGMRPGVWAH
jgi:hypothetical protein